MGNWTVKKVPITADSEDVEEREDQSGTDSFECVEVMYA